MSRSTPGYEPPLPAKDAPVGEAMKALSAQYRATAIAASECSCVARASLVASASPVASGGPSGAQEAASQAHCISASALPQVGWAYDLVFDTTASGQQIKCLTVVDEFTCECWAIDLAG